MFTEDVAANDIVAPSELQSGQATRSMPLQPVATTKPPSLPDALISAGRQAAVKQKAVSSEASGEASDRALRVPQGVAGAPLPSGTCASHGHCWPLHPGSASLPCYYLPGPNACHVSQCACSVLTLVSCKYRTKGVVAQVRLHELPCSLACMLQ